MNFIKQYKTQFFVILSILLITFFGIIYLNNRNKSMLGGTYVNPQTNVPTNLTVSSFVTSTISQWVNDAGYTTSSGYLMAVSGTAYSVTFAKPTTNLTIASTLLKRVTLPFPGYYSIGYTVSSTGGTSTVYLKNGGYLDSSQTFLTTRATTVALPKMVEIFSTSTLLWGAGNILELWCVNSASGGLGVLKNVFITYSLINTTTPVYFGEINYEK